MKDVRNMKVGLFIPCYINAVYPNVGLASYKLLTSLGLDVDYPLNQTCCGQPMANGGFEKDGTKLAKRMEDLFTNYDYVVGPSASCVCFVKETYPQLLEKDKHACLSSRIYEICEFLHDILEIQHLDSYFPHKVSIHNSCHGVRLMNLSSPSELNVPKYSKLRNLLSLVKGVEIYEPQREDECCGFGGLFSIEEPETSVCMGEDKVKDHMATGAAYITGADSSCLMHMEGVIGRKKMSVKTMHIVEILSASL